MPYISKNTAQQIVTTVKDVCGHDINYINTDGIIIASTDEKRIGDFHEIGYRAANEKITLEVFENNTYDGTQIGVNIPFLFHNETIGVIGITGEPANVRQYAHLALRIMRLLLRERELDADNELKRVESSYVARTLTQGQTISHPHLLQFLEQRKLSFTDIFKVILIQLTGTAPSSNITSYENKVESVLAGIRRSFYSYEYPDQYILIVEENSFESQKNIIEDLAGSLARVAIGSSQRLSNAQKSYSDALTAMKASAQPFIDFENLYVELLFSDLSFHVKQSFLGKTIASLSSKELHILTVYFANNMSLKQTSEELFIHKNTLQYQLGRIQAKTGLDPREFQDATTLYLAVKIKQTEQ